MSDDLEGLARLTGYLRALLASGQPLPEGLAGLARSLASRREREMLERIAADLAAGTPLSAAVGAQVGRDAPPLLVTLLRAGEVGGRLPQAVEALSGYFEAQRDLSRQLSAALLYPRIAVMVMVALVFPTLAWVQQQLGGDRSLADLNTVSGLPGLLGKLTHLLLWPFGHGSLVTGAIIAATAIVLFAGLPAVDRMTARLGRWFFTAAAVRRAATAAALARGLTLLLGAGVPVPDALRLLAGSSSDADARSQIAAAATRAESGLSLGQALSPVTALPPSFGWFLGLTDAQPERALVEAARFFEEEARDRAQLLANALQPLIVLALAVAFLPCAAVLVRLLAVVSNVGGA